MVTKLVLSAIGVAYVLLAGWCVALPEQTADAVGFHLKPGGGQSEYLVVYGGLQFALGVMFLWPLFQLETLRFSLLLCLVLHGCLVLFRLVSFFKYSGISTTTYLLAAVEWVILLLSLWRFYSDQATSLPTPHAP